MADTATDAPAAAPSISIGIAQQYVKDLSFESPATPQIFMEQAKQPDISVNFNVEANNIREDIFEVTLNVEVKSTIEDKPVFIAELAYAGLCQIKSTSPETTQQALMIEVPRQLFPFARAIIANTVRDGGFPPLMLNPIDFNQIYRNHQQNAAAAADKA
ncbi:MAG: protein-export chaperone SecB [Proteobacteria bacterium]|jgi:preprotein translocase subunit SecB|nr:protein-export chaperone SecB [Pseudomonadota bacterium]